MTWCQTASGKPISFLTPDSSNIDIADVALQLSRIPRFVGATRFMYSVAQHSVHVMQITKDASPTDTAAHLWALLHDVAEYVTGDLTTPFQQAVETLLPTGWPSPIKIIQQKLDYAVSKQFGIAWTDIEAVRPLVKRADMIALATERAQLLVPVEWRTEMPPPDEIELQQISAPNAEWLFRSKFEQCLAAYRQSKNKRLEAAE